MSDPLARLATLSGVPEALTAATASIDQLLWDRQVRARGGEITAESVLQGARDTAALEGAEVPLEALRAGSALDGSPLGQTVAAAVRVTAEVPRLVGTVGVAPAQAFARLASLAAAGMVDTDRVGRPRSDLLADDPMHLGSLPAPGEVAARLDTLVRLLVAPTEAPALVVASVVHGELLALRPFAWGSGLVARASFRLIIAARGLDPHLLTVPESGFLSAGRTAYVAALRGFMSGTPEGLASWIDLQCRAVSEGSRAAVVSSSDSH